MPALEAYQPGIIPSSARPIDTLWRPRENVRNELKADVTLVSGMGGKRTLASAFYCGCSGSGLSRSIAATDGFARALRESRFARER